MTPLPIHQRSPAHSCAIRVHARVEASRSALDALREAPAPPGSPALPPRFLRHCDEHAVVAMRAVLECMATLPEPPAADRCGVVAAPCQAGRIVTARSLAQLREGGAVTVSPHIIPQCSLHSLAGAVSVALGLHGPHVGVGGGPDAVAEGLFAAFTMLQGGAAAGCEAVWLIASEWDQEPTLDHAGVPVTDPLCRALALLLVPEPAAAGDRLSLSLLPGGDARDDRAPPLALADFCRAVEMCDAGSALASWGATCPWGVEVRVTARPAERSPAPLRSLPRRREAA